MIICFDLAAAVVSKETASHPKSLDRPLCVAGEGLSETEIEDMLSLSEEVLNDVYRFWTPPVRRLPPLLWVRIRHDLQEYLVAR